MAGLFQCSAFECGDWEFYAAGSDAGGGGFLESAELDGYGYVLGNPLAYTDPSGMHWFSGLGATISSIFSSLFGSGNDGCDPGVDFCGGTVQSGGVETTGSYGGGGILFSGGAGSSGGGGGGGGGGSTYDNRDVFRATSFISNPAKNGTRPCQNADPNNLDFTTPRYYGSENRTVSPYQHIMDRHVLPNSKPGTTRYVFGSDFTGVHNPAQTMTAVIKWDQLTFAKGTATQQGNGNIQFLYTIPPIKIDTGFGILTLKGDWTDP